MTHDELLECDRYLGNERLCIGLVVNGKLVVVTDKKEAKSIRKTNKSGGTTAEGDIKSRVALPSLFVRSEMKKAIDRAG